MIKVSKSKLFVSKSTLVNFDQLVLNWTDVQQQSVSSEL